MMQRVDGSTFLIAKLESRRLLDCSWCMSNRLKTQQKHLTIQIYSNGMLNAHDSKQKLQRFLSFWSIRSSPSRAISFTTHVQTRTLNIDVQYIQSRSSCCPFFSPSFPSSGSFLLYKSSSNRSQDEGSTELLDFFRPLLWSNSRVDIYYDLLAAWMLFSHSNVSSTIGKITANDPFICRNDWLYPFPDHVTPQCLPLEQPFLFERNGD